MSDAEDIEAQAAHWLARRDGDDWDGSRQAELDAWIDAAVSHRVAWLRLSSAWQRADRLAAVSPARPPAQTRQWLRHGGRWRIAAAVLLACGIGWLTAPLLPQMPAQQAALRYATAVGESKTLVLEDGTRLTLNTATGVRARIGGGKREVWLDNGEAFFDVAADKAHPFVIDAGRSRITVVGTRFSVRRDGQAVTVLVAEGKVRVDQGERQLSLGRNDAVVATEGRIVMSTKTPAQLDNLLGWREGRLVLDDLTLAQAAAEFNRYNRRQLVIEDANVARMAIGGSFSPTNIDGFTRLLQQGFGLRVQSTPERIIISR